MDREGGEVGGRRGQDWALQCVWRTWAAMGPSTLPGTNGVALGACSTQEAGSMKEHKTWQDVADRGCGWVASACRMAG